MNFVQICAMIQRPIFEFMTGKQAPTMKTPSDIEHSILGAEYQFLRSCDHINLINQALGSLRHRYRTENIRYEIVPLLSAAVVGRLGGNGGPGGPISRRL